MNYRKHTFLLLMSLQLAAVSLYAQDNGTIAKANEKYEDLAYIDSREVYLKVIDRGYGNPEIYRQLADSYYFNAELPEALSWYDAYIQGTDNPDIEYIFRYAQCLKSVGSYDAANELMGKMYQMSGSDSRAELYINEKNYLDLIELQSGRFELQPTTVNSSYSDFAPSFYGGQLVFASNRPSGGRASRLIHDWNDQPFLDLYMVQPSEDDSEPKRISKRLNSKYHESTAIFTKDGQRVYFTRNNYTQSNYKSDSQGTNRLKLYYSDIQNGKWSEPKEVPFNSDEYSVAHPALSADEKTLIFASDMPGTVGLSDLYKVDINGDGSFGEPESLGLKLNTEGRETFPFIDGDGNLYFASDGHLGLGGLDIFIAEVKSDGSFGEPFNLGEPVNSSLDDFTFIVNSNNDLGYFASNRDGGMGSDDIYSFKRVNKPLMNCFQLLSGEVWDSESNERLAEAKLLLLDENNNVIAETVSAVDGSFDFDVVDCQKAYAIRASKVNYDPSQESFVTGSDFNIPVKQGIYLKPKLKLEVGQDLAKILELNPIYFDYDKSNIRPDAAAELEKVIAVMKQYPTLKIDVRSHTDSRAPDAYNLKLSQRRNVSTLKYLMEQGGIDPSRITGRGYGETQLLNACANGIECPDELHQLNRRSEFIIVEK